MRWRFQSIGFAAFTIMSVLVFAFELRTFEQTHQNMPATQHLVATSPVSAALSLKSTFDALMVCSQAMFAPIARMQPKPVLIQISVRCDALYSEIIARTPTNGFAFFVAAQSAQNLGNSEARDTFLVRSVRFSPAEGWLAERRFAFAMNLPDLNNILIARSLASDIATLLSYQAGAELLANYSFLRPDAKTRIEPIVNVASPENRTRFNNLLTKRRAAA